MGGEGTNNASGEIRPMAALVVLGLSLAAVGCAAVRLALGPRVDPLVRAAEAQQMDRPCILLDRDGRPLAITVQLADLEGSPNALLRGHTPWRIASELHEVLAPVLPEAWTEADVLLRLLPEARGRALDLGPGWVAATGARLTALSGAQAMRLSSWTEEHGLEAAIWVDPAGGSDALCWCPSLLLSEEVRAGALGAEVGGHPERWTRWLLHELGLVLGHLSADSGSLDLAAGGLSPELLARLSEGRVRDERVQAYSDRLWAELVPSRHRVVAKGLDAATAAAVRELLAREGVTSWQLEARERMQRLHLATEDERSNVPMGSAQAIPGLGDKALEVLGHWGTLTRGAAERRAAWELEHEPWRFEFDGVGDPMTQRVDALMNEPAPWSGIERLVQHVLRGDASAAGAAHEWERVVLPRDVRKAISGLRREAKRRVEQARVDGVDADPLDLGLAEGRFDGYLDASAAERPLEVLTSIDTGLQLRAEELVRSVTEEHAAAGAMALVVEVASGEVLAIADHSGYALSGFMPAQYLFTPGSIMKPLVMAVAFDAGVVTPEERFRSNGMDGIRVAGRPRRVKEAKGAQPGNHTAAYGLAHSQNAVLVQLGMRIPPRRFHDRLRALGLGPSRDLGIGPIRDGVLLPVERWDGAERGTPVPGLTPASLSFGHAIQVNALQMAEALLTLLREGERTPLRFLRTDRGSAAPEQVLAAAECQRIVEYMRLGAGSTDEAFEGTVHHMHPDHPLWPESGHWRGTGAELAKRWFLGHGVERFGSKTGTTEKEAGVPCSHADARHWLRHEAEGSRCSSACRRELKGAGSGHECPCYTSSIFAFGEDAAGRQVMALVVVDEVTEFPLWGHFGSKVAGPVAARLLRRALGLPEQPLELARTAPAIRDSRSRGRQVPDQEASDRGDEGVRRAWLDAVPREVTPAFDHQGAGRGRGR